MNKRLVGIDVARSIAILGMIIVNFQIVFGSKDYEPLQYILSFFEGKAAALFVVLAGVGIGLVSKKALANNDKQLLHNLRKRILKRALFLFVFGLIFSLIYPPDILQFYSIYMLLAMLVLQRSKKVILRTALVVVLMYPLLLIFLDYNTGWNFDTLTYLDFWTFRGFFRKLLFNGFHPAIPWVAFLFVGIWLSRQNLYDDRVVKSILKKSIIVAITINILSKLSICVLEETTSYSTDTLAELLGTSPMPPLPFYMINGSAVAVAVIAICILIAKRYEGSKVIAVLHRTGQMAMSFYVAHIIVGMGVFSIFFPYTLERSTTLFSFLYAICFWLLCVVFANIWKSFRDYGPFEWLMRKLAG